MHDQAMARQRGVATLVVSVGVALLMAVAAVGMMRSGMLEQKIAANDIRAREAQEIAQAGLESIMASSYVPTQACVEDSNKIPDLSDGKLGAFNGSPSAPIGEINQTSKEGYALPSVKGCSSGGYYFARSQVELSSGSSKIKYFAEAWFKRDSFINTEINIPAPFLINGDFCTSSEKCSGGNILESFGIVDDESDSPGVVATGGVYIDFMNYQADSAVPNSSVLGGKTAWEYVFPGISFEDAKIKAGQDPNWFYLNENVNNNYGGLNSPVVVIVGKKNNGDCYHINGGAVIYGIIYFEDGCKANGWGNAKIYGSIVSDGSIFKLTAASMEFRKFTPDMWNKLKNMNNDGVFVVPGTWKDF